MPRPVLFQRFEYEGGAYAVGHPGLEDYIGVDQAAREVAAACQDRIGGPVGHVRVLVANVREQPARALLHLPERGLFQNLRDVPKASPEVIECLLPTNSLIGWGAGKEPLRQSLRMTGQNAT